jgi:hypothetical protein
VTKNTGNVANASSGWKPLVRVMPSTVGPLPFASERLIASV